MAKEEKKAAVVKHEASPIATREELPAHLRGKEGLGGENVGMKNLTVPRLQILQLQSPQLDEASSKYIHGTKVGDIINTLTGDNYGPSVTVVDAFFREEFMVAVPQNDGGGGGRGFRGIFTSGNEATDFLKHQNTRNEKLEIVEMGVHYALLIGERDEILTMIAIPMKVSQLKVSRKWNGLIKHKGGPWWASKWRLFTVAETNASGKPYRNYDITPAPGWSSEDICEVAEKLWKDVSGNHLQMHTVDIDAEEVPAEKAF